MLNVLDYPKISIITPSYNQGEYLEQTINSVLSQDYPNLEYIIIDGNSSDRSVEIIKKYESRLFYWHSQPDRGQSDAINQGFAKATGDIMGWLNSDDLLAPDALNALAKVYQPGDRCWTGGAIQISLNGSPVTHTPSNTKPITYAELLHGRLILNQVSTFWTRELWEKAGGYVSDLHLAMDYELWLRFTQITSVTPIYNKLGIFRTHEKAKTGTVKGYQDYLAECDLVRRKEYEKHKFNKIARTLLITFWTRYSLAKNGNWRHWVGRRRIPYI